jgi:hypothetical protein
MSLNSVSVPPPDDGGDGFSRSQMPDRLTRGQIAKWDAEKKWHDRDGLPLPTPMFVMGVTTALQRWQNQRPQTISRKPLPDPAQLNAAIPMNEWELDLTGRPRPPWQMVYVVYLVDLATGSPYTFASPTVGARIAFEQLQESVIITRALRGASVLPLVDLQQRPFKTNFGPKTRPHLQIIDWRTPGGEGFSPLPEPSSPKQLAAPATPAAAPAPPPAPAPAPAPTPAPVPPAAALTPAAAATLDATKPVKPVSMAEFVADELPWA